MSLRLSNGSTADRVVFAFFALVAVLAVESTVYAQDSFEYPEDRFYELLDDPKVSLDDARDIVAEEFDEFDAAEIAVYFCAPEPDIACEGSDVWTAWVAFLNGLYDGRTVDDVLDDMTPSDESLAIAIAIYWCSPPAGDGCDADQYIEKESVFAVENQVKERPAARAGGAQFFGGKKSRCSRTRGGRRC